MGVMNVELVWLAWNAQGHGVPLAVIEAMNTVDQMINDHSTWIGNDAAMYGSDPTGDLDILDCTEGWPAIIDGNPCEVPPEAMEYLKAWVRQVLDGKQWRTDPEIKATMNTPEVRAWAGVP